MLVDQEEHKVAPAKKPGKATSKRRLSARSNRCVGTTAGDDAELLDLCREFGALEQRILIATLSIDSEKVRNKITSPLGQRQDILLESIRATRPQTLVGCKAVASTLNLVTRFIGKSGTNWDLLTMLLSGLEKLKD